MSQLLLNIAEIDINYVDQLPSVHYASRNELPDSPGVYLAVVRIPDPRVIYVGFGKSLYSRWDRHSYKKYFDFLVAIGVPLTITYIAVDWSEDDLRLLEMLIIKKFDPPMNYVQTKKLLEGRPALTLRSQDRQKRLSGIVEPSLATKIASELTKPIEYYSSIELRSLARDLGMPRMASSSKEQIINYVKTALRDFYDESKLLESSETPKDLLKDEVLSLKGVRQLKKIASQLDVQMYSYMTKDELIDSISRRLQGEF